MSAGESEPASALDELPGDLMMWVLIVSELLVFGAGLAAFLGVRVTDPAGFAAARLNLHPTLAGVNTVVLITSGFFAARALDLVKNNIMAPARWSLFFAIMLGSVFLAIKFYEYADVAGQGISTETHPFFTFYYLLTGFHALHVVAGMIILGLVIWKTELRNVEVGTAFWHMVDLVWVLLFPVIYLLA
ncbi:cytochrome c oxidase subunit 3 [uncultured Roseibium sp.]|uniref:cytochrome c oxidase subunit 3 n=1 Tax=uncultured Roseibium sp. TaxID=1936171 RepID=UPI002636059B|nr:cytochrome c oxidase subunit 3 [uncultured Roseibium sp.]